MYLGRNIGEHESGDGEYWWACSKIIFFWGKGKRGIFGCLNAQLNSHMSSFLSITMKLAQWLWRWSCTFFGEKLSWKNGAISHIPWHDKITLVLSWPLKACSRPSRFPPKISPPMDQSLLKSILMLQHCHSPPSTSPQISSFPHPVTDLRSGHCWDTVTVPTFPLLQCH